MFLFSTSNKKLFPVIEDFWVWYLNLVSTFEEALLIFEP